MDRVKKADVDQALVVLNNILKTRGGFEVHREGRYGYQALELYDNRGLVRTIRTGMSTRGALYCVQDMISGIMIYQRGQDR